MNTQTLVIILVAVLVIFAGVQAIQINSLKDNISPVSAATAGQVNQANQQYAPQQQPTQMVGGC